MAMEDQAKLLADLTAAISSMNAKLDSLHPVVLELNQCRPGVERAVDAHSSSSKSASASKQASAATATSYIDVCTCASPFATNTGFVTMVPATCSSDCLPQQPMAAPVLVGSSSSILTKDGRSTTPATWATTSFVAMESLVRSSSNTGTSDSAPPFTREDTQEMLEPMSELFDKSEDAVTSRPPRRPPELGATSDQNFIREPLSRPWPLHACDIEPVQCACDIEPVQRDSCSPSEDLSQLSNWLMLNGGSVSRLFSTLDGHLLDFPCGASVSISWSCYQELNNYFSSGQPKESLLLNSMGKPDNSYDQFTCAIRGPSYGPGFFVNGGRKEVIDPCLTGHLFLLDSSTIIIMAKFLARTKEPKDILLYVSELVASKLLDMFREFEHWWNYMLQACPSWRSDVLMEQNTIGRKNWYLLLLSWVSEQEKLSLDFQFQQSSSILLDWYLGKQSIMARLRPYYSLQYKLSADTGSSRFLCVRSVGAAVHVFVLPVGIQCQNRQNVQSAIRRDALLFLIQSVILNYVDYRWLPTVVLSKIVSIFSALFPFPEQLEVTCSVQTNLLLAHDVDPGDVLVHHVKCESGPCVTPGLASGAIDKIASFYEIVLGKEFYAPWDPGGHTTGAIDGGGLRASRMLRRGECHGPCGLLHRVAWAAARRELPAQGLGTEGSQQMYLKGEQDELRGMEELEPGRRTLARAAATLSSSPNTPSLEPILSY